MQKLSATLYFDGTSVAEIDDISYDTPFFVGRHHFADPRLAELLTRICQFGQSRYWLDDTLSDDEQDKKLDQLQQKLKLSDEELANYFYRSDGKWHIKLMPQNQCFKGLPIIDSQFIEWR